jgi:hypothetical protein
MQVVGGRLCAMEICSGICMRALIDTAFNPYLGRTVILPVGEGTNAIAAGKDIVQVMFELRERKVFIHHLSHLKARLHIKGNFGDNTERSKPNYSTLKSVA